MLLSLVTFQKAFLYIEKSLRSINPRTYPHNNEKKCWFLFVVCWVGFFPPKYNNLIFVIWGLVWVFFPKPTQTRPPKPKDNLKNLLKEGFEYSVAASPKTLIESGDKTHLRSQFRTVILMSDTVITKETQISFCQLSMWRQWCFPAKENVLQ